MTVHLHDSRVAARDAVLLGRGWCCVALIASTHPVIPVVTRVPSHLPPKVYSSHYVGCNE
jgi:hypothetical protein